VRLVVTLARIRGVLGPVIGAALIQARGVRTVDALAAIVVLAGVALVSYAIRQSRPALV